MPSYIQSEEYGTTKDGQQVKRYILKNDKNITVRILDFGGIVTSIVVPDKHGYLEDITPGFDTLAEYEVNPAYFGAVVGRICNRIFEGKFQIDGIDYEVAVNKPPNHLHGGDVGFDKKVFSSHVEGSKLFLSYTSVDGEEGYPGTLKLDVTYELTDDDELAIEYKATTDKPTLCNLTNHAYFNLNGHQASTIADHVLTVHADHFLPKTRDVVPTGAIQSVQDTVFDFRKPTLLGERIPQMPGPPSGFDHNYCLKGENDKVLAATLVHPASGRILDLYTNQPGVQVYTGNFLNCIPGKGGVVYQQHSSMCLEAQNYPDAIHNSNFPSCILRPGEEYHQKTWYKFRAAH